MKKLGLSVLLLFLLTGSLAAQDVVLKKGVYILRDNGKPFSGVFREFDPENRLASELSIKDGFLDGASQFYYPSGSRKEIRTYKAGKKHGTWSMWNAQGIKTSEASFSEGLKDGAWFVWDDNGVKRYEMYYKNGAKTGSWIIWDETGKEISRENF
jgi:antitoxin component YwqK of YwqJK toxin-antitoxin module